MLRAVWNGAVLAEADQTVHLDGNYYFPTESVNWEYLRASQTTTSCPWKGVAHYYHVVVDGEINPDAVWYYATPSPPARKIKNHVAFWNGVAIEGPPAAVQPARYGPVQIVRNLWR